MDIFKEMSIEEATFPYYDPILFLDIDGVINVYGDNGNEEPLRQLLRIIETTKCRIVLSSMWRLDGLDAAESAMRSKLEYKGPKLYDMTPDLKGAPRGNEIAAWIASSIEPMTCWAVVDDIGGDEMKYVQQRFIQTNPRIGIDEFAADCLIELLINWN